MHKPILAVFLAAFLINPTCYAQGQMGLKTKDDEEAEKVFAAVFRLRLDYDGLVNVRLRDGSQLKGYITDANDEGFTIVPPESRLRTKLTYQEVKDVKKYRSQRRRIGSIIGYAGMTAIIAAMAVGYARK